METNHPWKKFEKKIALKSRIVVCTNLFCRLSWLSEPVEDWINIPAYLKFANFAHNVPISNAATERTVKRTTDYLNYGGQTEEDLQSVLLIVGKAIKRAPSVRTKHELEKSFAKDPSDT